MGSKRTPMTLMMVVTLVCAILPALGAVLPPSAFAQREDASLGDQTPTPPENTKTPFRAK